MGKVSRALNKSDGIVEKFRDLPGNGNSGGNREKNALEEKDPASVRISHEDDPNLPFAKAEEQWDERLAIASENFSTVAESFRKLRTLILHPDKGEPARTILVVSANAQEGKSFVCANLGIRLATGIGRTALLLDCDLRRPSLHTLFGHSNDTGLSNYLTEGRNIANLIQRTRLPGLTILPSGPPPENPAELITSDKFSSLIEEISDEHRERVIVIDSPPVMAASETLVLAQLVDKVVLVVRWGKSGREEVGRVVEHIGREKFIGCVFNAFEMNILDRKIQGVGYYNYYRESYY